MSSSHYLRHSAPLFKKYNLLNVYDIFLLEVCTFMYKELNNKLPRERGWRWIAERPVASDKVPEGGHLSIFSPFLSLLFCFKDRRPSCGRSG